MQYGGQKNTTNILADAVIKENINKILFGKKYFKHKQNIGDIVIDTLNVVMFIDNNVLSIKRICKGIEYISNKLKRFFSGRIMFVVKDRDNLFNTLEIREDYKKLVKKLKIYVYIAEKYEHNLPNWKGPSWYAHSAKGRDDLSAIILAQRFNCPILTNDNFFDSIDFKSTIPPFKLLEYNWFSAKIPIVEMYKPENLEKKFEKSNTRIKLNNIFVANELNSVAN